MKRKFKTFTVYVLIFSVMFLLTSCGEIRKSNDSVNGMFIELKNLNFEAMKNYIDIDEDNDENNIEEALPILEVIADNIDYNIISSKQTDNNTVIVKTEVTSVNMVPILSEYIAQAFQYALANAFSETPPTDEEQNKQMTEMFINIITNTELESVTNEVDIKVVKNEKNSWMVQVDDNLANAIFGGLVKAADKMESIAQ